MHKLALSSVALVLALAACEPQQMTLEQAIDFCSEKAAQAAGPTGSAEIGVGSEGTFANITIGISDSYLRGDDPQLVYDRCMAANAPKS